MKVLVVDDELLARRRLVRMLETWDDVEIIAEATDGLEARAFIEAHNPDVVLLDIDMPECDGLTLAATTSIPAVIFVTAHRQHAIEAFDLAAIDYLLKPVRRERLRQALDRVTTSRTATPRSMPSAQPACDRDPVARSTTAAAAPATLERPAPAVPELSVPATLERPASATLERPAPATLERPASAVPELSVPATLERPASAELSDARRPPRLSARAGATMHVFDARTITRLHARDKVTLFWVDGVEYALEASLAELEARLVHWEFIRVHRAELVNLAAIVRIRLGSGESEVELRDGTRAPVSRRMLGKLRQRLLT